MMPAGADLLAPIGRYLVGIAGKGGDVEDVEEDRLPTPVRHPRPSRKKETVTNGNGLEGAI